MNLRFNSKLVALFRFQIMLLGHGASFLKLLGGLTWSLSETESISEVLKTRFTISATKAILKLTSQYIKKGRSFYKLHSKLARISFYYVSTQ